MQEGARAMVLVSGINSRRQRRDGTRRTKQVFKREIVGITLINLSKRLLMLKMAVFGRRHPTTVVSQKFHENLSE